MKPATLISQIISHLTSEGYSNINIEESSLFSRLTYSERTGANSNAPEKITNAKIKYDPSRRFPLCHLLLMIITFVFDIVYDFVVYRIPGTIAHCFQSSRSPKTLRRSPRYNCFLLITYILLFICGTVVILNFYIRDILFFTSPGYSNRQGAMVMEQPLLRTHHMFLFNTAQLWGDTGIEVMDGDEVEITVSGGFFNSIISQIKQARTNVIVPDAQYFNPTLTINDGYSSKNTFRNFRVNPDADYGAVLYRIVPEIMGNQSLVKSDTLNQGVLSLSKQKAIIHVTSPGTLQLTINDITLLKDSINGWNRTPAPEILKNLAKSYTYPEFYDAINANDPDSINKFINYLSLYPDICFYDNIGEILFNINVIRNPWNATDRNTADRFLAWIFSKITRLVERSIQSPWGAPLSGIGLFCLLFLLTDFLSGCYLRRRARRSHSEDAL